MEMEYDLNHSVFKPSVGGMWRVTHLARPIRDSCGTFLLEISKVMDFPLAALSVMPTLIPASTSKSGISTWVVKTFLFLLYFIVSVASVDLAPKVTKSKRYIA